MDVSEEFNEISASWGLLGSFFIVCLFFSGFHFRSVAVFLFPSGAEQEIKGRICTQ